jgi:hypothetical protein
MAKHKNRIAVYLQSESPSLGTPRHFASKQFVQLLVTCYVARWVSASSLKQGAQLRTAETWTAIKSRFRRTAGEAVIPGLLPPQEFEHPLMLSYPPADCRTNGRELQRLLWMQAERF